MSETTNITTDVSISGVDISGRYPHAQGGKCTLYYFATIISVFTTVTCVFIVNVVLKIMS